MGGRYVLRHPERPSVTVGSRCLLPTGSTDNLTRDGKARFLPKVLFSGAAMFVYAAANTGVLFRGFAIWAMPRSETGSAISGAAAGVRVADDSVRARSYGNTVFGQKNDAGSAIRHPSVWRSLDPTRASSRRQGICRRDFRLRAGAGPGLTKAPGTPVLRGVLSAAWVPKADAPPPDSDGDGIIDQNDACKDVKGIATNDPKTNGCPPPPPPPDSDGDGIIDANDACKDVKGVASADPSRNGCPPDKDGDGILDTDDACPEEPGIASQDPKLNGCADTDKDGIFDKVDACKDQPGKASPDPKLNGCPDKDGDGVFDSVDACPDTPGKPNEDPKKNGCPLALVVGTQIRITEQVEFDTGKSTIKPASADLLKKVGDILRDNANFTLIRVEGHTDNRGNKGANLVLSKQRADSVKKWLVDKEKIDAKRLTTAGFGQDKPVDTNDTEAGRQNNRRVEFHVEKDSNNATPPATPPATTGPAKPPVTTTKPPATPPAPKAPPAQPAPKPAPKK
ncbi:MAG: OmpA family protein [Polyangiaceae bacterium]